MSDHYWKPYVPVAKRRAKAQARGKESHRVWSRTRTHHHCLARHCQHVFGGKHGAKISRPTVTIKTAYRARAPMCAMGSVI